ncbi:hypothetical protein BUL40_06990 [Croceivirga radicis]|uniref:Guanylate cyclase domain-containing protein n=1 Tax=Croceivirga radicis TaxID=1929488 RepID=A0A1V6LRN7_9FLAO|nr:adenylate/guanylate cyclase domain-containing protein [Croceivirga radicis]OQD42835.1 hypothetical protein BUL40_06990 [Croceivirga radicis]
MNPILARNWRRILPFGLIWFVLGFFFMANDYFALGDNPVASGAIDPTFSVLVFALLAIFSLGLLIGIFETLYVNKLFRNFSFIRTILSKFVLYSMLFTLMVGFSYPIAAALELDTDLKSPLVWFKFRQFWQSDALYGTAIQLLFSLTISLIYAEIRDNLGDSVLLNIFTGKYHKPIQEERIFMFVDMKDSTTIAEKLGHVSYFTFLQQYYNDMAEPIVKHRGEVYQYIGDEIVISWPKAKGIAYNNAVNCFFAMQKAMNKRDTFYINTYGVVPKFKAALHMGMVTTGELGALKKEIVFTGDVLNTTARIQDLCNNLKSKLLVSEHLRMALKEETKIEFVPKGAVELKGKHEIVNLYAVHKKIPYS